MKTKDIALVAAGGIALFAAYQYFMRPTPPPGYAGAQYIPAGGQWNGFGNASGQPVWVQAVGATAQIVNSLGQVLSTIPWSSLTGGGGSTITAADIDPNGNW
jgi:hypothetical protein